MQTVEHRVFYDRFAVQSPIIDNPIVLVNGERAFNSALRCSYALRSNLREPGRINFLNEHSYYHIKGLRLTIGVNGVEPSPYEFFSEAQSLFINHVILEFQYQDRRVLDIPVSSMEELFFQEQSLLVLQNPLEQRIHTHRTFACVILWPDDLARLRFNELMGELFQERIRFFFQVSLHGRVFLESTSDVFTHSNPQPLRALSVGDDSEVPPVGYKVLARTPSGVEHVDISRLTNESLLTYIQSQSHHIEDIEALVAGILGRSNLHFDEESTKKWAAELEHDMFRGD